MTSSRYLPNTIVQTVKLYAAAILFFTAFRVILFLTELHRVNENVPLGQIFQAFVMGLRFDVVISGYIMILPFTLLTIANFFRAESRIITTAARYFVGLLFSLAFLVCAIDIPYFNQFFARLSITAFEWFDSPVFVAKMVLQEPRYWLVAVPLVMAIYFFLKMVKRIFERKPATQPGLLIKLLAAVLGLGLILLGMRGRIEAKTPIMVGVAYFSNNAFLNQLGLNPNFTLMRSYLDSKNVNNESIHLMNDTLALQHVRGYFGIDTTADKMSFAREVTFDSSNATPYNVVLVIMESMSAEKMKRHGNEFNLTPFLDSISYRGLYFENAYSAGIHTFNGVFGTLFSYPALFRQHAMKETAMNEFGGIFRTLRQHNYSTIYLTTHDGQFDNVEGFLKANDCELFVSKPDYPSDKVKTTLGVPDDYMFQHAIPELNKLHARNKPFFAAFMTASDHGPYYIPEYFKGKCTETRQRSTEYADYSLRKLVDLSAQQPWFANTIFVFVADHGANLDGRYAMPISYNHVPLLFYAPSILSEPKTFSEIAGQIDVYPSIMGLLRLPYTNNTLGINLFEEKRPYIYFNGDDKYGVIDNNWFLIVRDDKSRGLYKYRDKDTYNYATENPAQADKMDLYAKSNMQAFQYLIHQKGHR